MEDKGLYGVSDQFSSFFRQVHLSDLELHDIRGALADTYCVYARRTLVENQIVKDICSIGYPVSVQTVHLYVGEVKLLQRFNLFRVHFIPTILLSF